MGNTGPIGFRGRYSGSEEALDQAFEASRAKRLIHGKADSSKPGVYVDKGKVTVVSGAGRSDEFTHGVAASIVGAGAVGAVGGIVKDLVFGEDE